MNWKQKHTYLQPPSALSVSMGSILLRQIIGRNRCHQSIDCPVDGNANKATLSLKDEECARLLAAQFENEFAAEDSQRLLLLNETRNTAPVPDNVAVSQRETDNPTLLLPGKSVITIKTLIHM